MARLKDPQYIARDEKYAVIDGEEQVRILHKDGPKARLLAHRFQEQNIGPTPYRVARVVVFELVEEDAKAPVGARSV